MGIMDIEENLEYMPVLIEKTNNVEKRYAMSLFRQGGVYCVIAEDETNLLLDKIAKVHNLNINSKTPFANKIWGIIQKAFTEELKAHASRDIISLDCRWLMKGDAYGWMQSLAKNADNQIVVINYVTQIPDGDRSLYDDPIYVENLLVRSWKNEDVYFGDSHINRRNMTIILACQKEDEDKLMHICGLCSYGWWGNFNEKQQEFENYIKDKNQKA